MTLVQQTYCNLFLISQLLNKVSMLPDRTFAHLPKTGDADIDDFFGSFWTKVATAEGVADLDELMKKIVAANPDMVLLQNLFEVWLDVDANAFHYMSEPTAVTYLIVSRHEHGATLNGAIDYLNAQSGWFNTEVKDYVTAHNLSLTDNPTDSIPPYRSLCAVEPDTTYQLSPQLQAEIAESCNQMGIPDVTMEITADLQWYAAAIR